MWPNGTAEGGLFDGDSDIRFYGEMPEDWLYSVVETGVEVPTTGIDDVQAEMDRLIAAEDRQRAELDMMREMDAELSQTTAPQEQRRESGLTTPEQMREMVFGAISAYDDKVSGNHRTNPHIGMLMQLADDPMAVQQYLLDAGLSIGSSAPDGKFFGTSRESLNELLLVSKDLKTSPTPKTTAEVVNVLDRDDIVPKGWDLKNLTAAQKKVWELRQRPEVKAFLDLLAYAEGGAYDVQFGPTKFSDYSKHPGTIVVKGQKVSASGRYQMTTETWDGAKLPYGLKNQYSLSDFSPNSQDIGAIGLLIELGADKHIVKSEIKSAIEIAAKRWAAFPGASGKSLHNQPFKPMPTLLKQYDKFFKGYKR